MQVGWFKILQVLIKCCKIRASRPSKCKYAMKAFWHLNDVPIIKHVSMSILVIQFYSKLFYRACGHLLQFIAEEMSKLIFTNYGFIFLIGQKYKTCLFAAQKYIKNKTD